MTQQHAPGWYADPTSRHQLRYYNGADWTEHVSDHGATSTDPVEAAPENTSGFFSRSKEERQAEFARREAERKTRFSPEVMQAKAAERQTEKALADVASGTRPDIAAAKAKMRVKLGSGREIKKLPEHLWDDETVEMMSSGQIGQNTGLVVLTSHRLIFLFAGLMNSQFEDFPIGNISSISFKSSLLFGSIVVHASGNNAVITNVNKPDAKAIADAIRARLGRPAQAASAAPQMSDADELAKWKNLLDQGVITAEDFEAKKRQLLGL